MSVQLNPSSQLGFQRPLTQLVKRTLSVSNSNSQPVAFKVKTTAPKQYCVRPNSGRIEPGETVEVQVLLQPMKEDPAPGTKCRDKFLVQSVIISTERETASLAELWSAVEKEDKAGAKEAASIHEQKIRCSYLPASEDGAAVSPTMNGGSAISATDESKFATIRPSNGHTREALDTSLADSTNSSHSPAAQTPPMGNTSPAPSYSVPSAISTTAEKAIAGSGAAVAGAAAAVGLASVASAVEDRTAVAKQNVAASEPPSTPATSAPTQPKPTTTSGGSSIESELAAAKAEIARLQAQLSQAETTAATLRSRGGAAEKVSSGGAEPGTAQAVVQTKGADGVPLEVVAGLVFGVFVITWLFL